MHMHRHVTRQTAPSGSIPLHTTALTLHKQSAPSKGQLRRIKPPTLIGCATQTNRAPENCKGRPRKGEAVPRPASTPEQQLARGIYRPQCAPWAPHGTRGFLFFGAEKRSPRIEPSLSESSFSAKETANDEFWAEKRFVKWKSDVEKNGADSLFPPGWWHPSLLASLRVLFRWCLCFSRQGPLFPTGSSQSFLL